MGVLLFRTKQQTSNFPPNVMRNGSVQVMGNLVSASSDWLTAKFSWIGNSGGTTDAMISKHSTTSLCTLRFPSAIPFSHTNHADMIANASKTKMKTALSQVPAVTR